VRGDAPVPQVPAAEDEPVEREQRRTVTRELTCPRPAGLMPAAAIAGNLLRGARGVDGRKVFLVAAVTHERAAVLGQREVPDKRGENVVIADLLGPLGRGRHAADVGCPAHDQGDHPPDHRAAGARYMLFLKRNQPLALQTALRHAPFRSSPTLSNVATSGRAPSIR
jgi:hypothetical protein